MKRVALITFILLCFVNCNAQSKKNNLSDKIDLTYHDFLNLKLQILAAQISSGSYTIVDMGKFLFPVSISLNRQNIIVFKIEGDLDLSLPIDKQKEIMQEGFQFVKVSIMELLRLDFPLLDFDSFNNIIGFWNYVEAYDPCARWERDEFSWIRN
ncbi:MAG: hypothetical protein IH598_00480 [Bacteroidales bacterium]|nr:hypothetical protein [Bacteroidales bacterium]